MSNIVNLHVPKFSSLNSWKIFTQTGLPYHYSRSPQAARRFNSSADPWYSTNRHRSTEYSSEKRLEFPVLSSRAHRRSPQLQVNGEGSVTRDAQAARANPFSCLSSSHKLLHPELRIIIGDPSGGVVSTLKHNRNSKALL
jgi:hypothetical protein